MTKLTLKQKKRWALAGGVSGFIIGGWMLFITKTFWGFVPAILGATLLIFGRRSYG